MRKKFHVDDGKAIKRKYTKVPDGIGLVYLIDMLQQFKEEHEHENFISHELKTVLDPDIIDAHSFIVSTRFETDEEYEERIQFYKETSENNP